jgi:hypothetical protein
VLLAFIGMGAWWAHTSGLLMTAAERDTSVANPPATTAPEDFNGADDSTRGIVGQQPGTGDRPAEFLLRRLA